MSEQKDSVSNLHPKYSSLQESREMIADVRKGTKALRAKGEKYLPKNPMELPTTYAKRLKTATFENVYAKTEKVMTGLVFQSEIDTSKVNPAIIPLLENIDNKGNHINIFARNAFEKSFDGASVILVDAPSGKAQDREQEQKFGLRPYWVLYDACNVINWRYRINPTSKATELSLIVFKEVNHQAKGQFAVEKTIHYRVWFLDEKNVVSWELWQEKQNDKLEKEFEKIDFGTVERLNALPVVVIGSLENEPPLLDLAYINIKHYQKESNFDNLEAQAGVPLFYTKGYTATEDLPVGSDIHYKLPKDGDIGWAQLDASGFASLKDSLKDLVEQMSLLGLSQLANRTAKVDLTATEALLNNIGETAEIRVMAEQLKDGLEQALNFTGQYLGLGNDKGGSIVLGTAWKNESEIQSANIEGAIV